MPEISKPQIAAFSGALVGAAFAVGLLVPDSKPAAAPPAPLPRVQIGARLDTGKHNAEMLAYRAQHPNAVDLLTGPVEPGKQVTTGVNVEFGKRPAGVEAVGGSWTIDGVSFEDRAGSTWIEVKATNTGTEPARFVGMVEVP
jgi:hypothetical protein